MNISQFSYTLPKKLIAKYPLANRSASRLMVLNANSGQISHQNFIDLIHWVHPQDLLVFNNTKVLHARLFGQKESGGKVEILIERILGERKVLARVRASKKPKPESLIQLEQNILVKVINAVDEFMELEFMTTASVMDILERVGHVPLPPYLERADERMDQQRYQTVFAKIPGAVAAPTASLHFDESLLNALKDKQIETAELTLHVGSGTFQPIRETNIKQHKMHAEQVVVDKEVCHKIEKTKKRGGRVVAVGTTVVRALESASIEGSIQPYEGDTQIFIYPGFQFNCIDAMITNFHLSESTLLMLVCAFGGYEHIMQAYQEAIQEEYRFYSYGDAMLITCEKS